MINKFAKMRDGWFTKIILSITALSFVSLFGVSGYISAANNNKAVLKVDKYEISQNAFAHMLQNELRKFQIDSDDAETADELKKQITQALLQSKTQELIIQNTMDKYKLAFTDGLIRQIILLSPQFQNKGAFDHNLYKMFLDHNGWTEQDFVNNIKIDVARKLLVDSQIAFSNVPQILRDQMAKTLGQRRTFKYVQIINNNAQITREPTIDELDQYYSDMSEELMIPEKRDLTIMFLSQDELAKSIEIPQEEIDSYYKEHIDDFEQPEQRAAFQMVFEDEQQANSAYDKLLKGDDFVAVAQSFGQSREDVDLGYVSQNDISDDLHQIIFGLNINSFSKPQNIGDTWQILQVTDEKPAYKMPREQANAKIAEELRQDKMYDYNYEIISQIEDKLGAGKTLQELSAAYGTALLKVANVAENGENSAFDTTTQALLSNKDIIDTAFSYNEGEISQAVETDDGIAVVQIDKIYEEHQMPREEATAKLKAFWQENERASITQELIDNIQHDLDAGDDLPLIAKRYALLLKNTMPVTRGENFADLGFTQMKDLFTAPKGDVQIIQSGDDYIVAVTTDIYDDSAALSDEDKSFLFQALYTENQREMAEALLKDYAKNYKIEVNYNRLGIID